jgi:polyhydroxyalkanoate synthesis regulator phasin
MSDEPADIALRLGDLLIRSGVVTIEALEDAVVLAMKMPMPLDRVLGMNGHLNAAGMQAALQLQDMIDSKQISLDSAVKVLELVALQSMDFNTALRKLAPGVEKSQGKLTNKLGETMRKAGVVNPKNLEQGLMQSLNTGLPLGMVLMGMGAITNQNLHSTLLAQRLVRDGELTPEEGIQALRFARLHTISLQQSLEQQRIHGAAIKLHFGVGELFVLSGFMTEGQLLSSQELELVEDKTIEQVLQECGYATPITLEASMRLLDMVKKGTLFEDQAANILKRLKHTTTYAEMNESLSNLGDTDVESNKIDVSELLTMAGLVSDEDIAAATPLSLSNRVSLVKTLQQVGIIDAHTITAVQDCKDALDSGIITAEQAVIAVVYAGENNKTLEETLKTFGWAPTVLIGE